MISLSLNLQGLGGPLKVPALKHLAQIHNLDLYFLQETMCLGQKVEEALRPFLKGWNLCSSDSIRLSRGLITTWSPRLLTMSS
jgi:hypothetical protein